MKKKVAVLMLGCLLLAPSLYAEEITCSDDSGSCALNETEAICNCADGTSIGSGASVSMEQVGVETDVTQEACEAMLLTACMGRAVEDECITEKGGCVVFSDGTSYCICADGSGFDEEYSEPGYEGEDPVYPTDPDPDTDGGSEIDEKLFDGEGEAVSCEDVLAEECPNDPPNPAEECSSEALALCNSLVDWYETCYEETIWPFMVVECCDEYEDNSEEMTTVADCLEGKGCDEAEDCFPTYDAVDEAMGALFSGDSKDSAAGDSQGTSNEEGDDGEVSEDDLIDCSQAPAGSALVLILMLGLGLTWRRRSMNV